MLAEWFTPGGPSTAQDLSVLGPSFTRAWAVDGTPRFGELLLAIDDADREIWREPNRHAECIRKGTNIHPDWLR